MLQQQPRSPRFAGDQNSSDISDADCCDVDVDEMMVISEHINKNKNQKQTQQQNTPQQQQQHYQSHQINNQNQNQRISSSNQNSDKKLQLNATQGMMQNNHNVFNQTQQRPMNQTLKETTNHRNYQSQQTPNNGGSNSFGQRASSLSKRQSDQRPSIQANSKYLQENQISQTALQNINHSDDPETNKDFNRAYQKLVQKLGQEEGAHLLIPQEDLVRLQNQHKLDVNELSHKINQFEEKKRQKIHLLKEEKDQKEIEECKFQPEILTRKRNEAPQHRNLDQFLQDQKRYEELKKQKQSERVEENVKSQLSQTIRGPYVNDKSRKMLEQRQSRVNSQQRDGLDSTRGALNKNKENTSVTRLSNINSRLNSSASKNTAADYSFKPQINKKSHEIQRDRPTQDTLYEEAFRRKAKLQQKEKEIYQQPERQVNKESQKLVVQKFQREFLQALIELFQVEELPKEINYLNMKQLLVLMGFCTEQAANSDSNERVLLYDIWRVLEGDQRDLIVIEDLRTLLIAIVKITEYKRINVVPSEEESKHLDQNSVGYFNLKGQYCIRPEDLSIIYKQFDLLNVNRIQYTGRVQQDKKTQQKQEHSFKPQLSKKTEGIASQYRQKLAEQINEEKISTFEWLAAQGNKDEWRQNAKQVLEKESLKECTFKPNLQRESSNNRSQISHAKRDVSNTSKSRTRDYGSSGDRFNDLYNLAKRMQQKPKTDKTTEEIEFEKAKDECSFAPNRNKVNNQSEQLPTTQHDKPLIEDKYVQKDIERLRKAREERERVKKYTERGIILNESTSKNSTSSSIIQKQRPQTVTNATSLSRQQSEFSAAQNSYRAQHQQKSSLQNQRLGYSQNKSSVGMFNPIPNSSNDITPAKPYSQQNDNESLRQQNIQQQKQLVQQQIQKTLQQPAQTPSQPIKSPEQPLLFIDINLGEESTERIVVYEGDSAKELAQKFCELHNLDEETQVKLEEQLAAQIRSVLSKIDEESEIKNMD
eukprot:403332030